MRRQLQAAPLWQCAMGGAALQPLVEATFCTQRQLQRWVTLQHGMTARSDLTLAA